MKKSYKNKIIFTCGHLQNVVATQLQHSHKCHSIVMKMIKRTKYEQNRDMTRKVTT